MGGLGLVWLGFHGCCLARSLWPRSLWLKENAGVTPTGHPLARAKFKLELMYGIVSGGMSGGWIPAFAGMIGGAWALGDL